MPNKSGGDTQAAMVETYMALTAEAVMMVEAWSHLASTLSNVPPGATSASPRVRLACSGEAERMLLNSHSFDLMASSFGRLLKMM